MLLLELVSTVLSLGLSNLISFVLFNLFIKNAFKKIITRSFIHIKNSFSHNGIDHFLRSMIYQIPILIVNRLIFQSPSCIFLYISPFLLILYFVKQCRIFNFDLLNFFDLLRCKLLAALVLLNESFQFSLIVKLL